MLSNSSQKIRSNSLLEFLKKLRGLHQLRIWKFRRIDQFCASIPTAIYTDEMSAYWGIEDADTKLP